MPWGAGRVWGHVAGIDVCGRGSDLQHGRGQVAGVGTCGRVLGHVAGVVAGCGDMWKGGGVCDSGSGLWHGWEHQVGWEHVVG